jgi:hypothetical protein
MPNANVGGLLQNPCFCQLSPDNQSRSLASLDLDFAALPREDRAKVIDFGRARYDVPAPAAARVNVERLNDSLTHLAVNLSQNLALGAPRGLANIAPTGTDLTGLIHKPFNTDLGDKVQSKLQNLATELRRPDERTQNSGVARLGEQGIRAVGKLAGSGAAGKVLTGADLAANQRPHAALQTGYKRALLGRSLERAGGLQAFISQ